MNKKDKSYAIAHIFGKDAILVQMELCDHNISNYNNKNEQRTSDTFYIGCFKYLFLLIYN